jgi:hypothetical protein
MDNNLNNIIKEGNHILNQSSNYHLPLSFRNKLLKAIRDENVIGRLSILCALKVYHIWEQFIPGESELIALLQQSEIYLNTQKDEAGLLENAGKMKTYVSSKNDKEHFSALFAGYAIVNAAYEVTGKDLSATFDDFEIDSFDWDSAFWAVLAYNGGAVSCDKVDVNKSKEFWNWYLHEGLPKALSNEQIVFSTDKSERKSTEIARNYLLEISTNLEIWGKVDAIRILLIRYIPIINWNKVEISIYKVNMDYTARSCYYDETSHRNDLPIPIEADIELNNIICFIKDEIYKLEPKAGAFYIFRLCFDKKGGKETEFVFDTIDDGLKQFSDARFAEDFKKYPRAINYIPFWLQKILKREKVDINSFKWD